MDSLRQSLKDGLLGRSLDRMREADRLSAAWLIVCGRVLAQRGEVSGYEDGKVTIAFDDEAWMDQFRGMQTELANQLERIARVRVTGIHFIRKRSSTQR